MVVLLEVRSKVGSGAARAPGRNKATSRHLRLQFTTACPLRRFTSDQDRVTTHLPHLIVSFPTLKASHISRCSTTAISQPQTPRSPHHEQLYSPKHRPTTARCHVSKALRSASTPPRAPYPNTPSKSKPAPLESPPTSPSPPPKFPRTPQQANQSNPASQSQSHCSHRE